MLTCLSGWVYTNFDVTHYEDMHPWGMHIVPGIWSTLVALRNTSILPARALAFCMRRPWSRAA